MRQQEAQFSEDVEIRGHIIDSLILPKILDIITSSGGKFRIKNITIGQARKDPSGALIEVSAPSEEQLSELLSSISDHGAVRVNEHDCEIEVADIASAFPEGFYSTTNQRTEVRLDGQWVEVAEQEMDCGIAISADNKSARCVPMLSVSVGDRMVVGHVGVRVFPLERQDSAQSFEFMNSAVSTEKPKGVAIRKIAEQLFETKQKKRAGQGSGDEGNGGKSLIVGGPAIIHTGSSKHLQALIERGYVDKLFAGNALATHDIEQAFFGTSLGVNLTEGDIIEAGHEHHLRAINRIRRAGGIKPAVEKGILTSGVMYTCVKHDVDYVLAGSIRDDGPLTDVVTDAVEAQELMREKLRDVSFCLMIATTLHSIAVGNLLPATTSVVCVDINPSTVIKLSDRGSFQTVGLVTDVAPFMNQLITELDKLEAAQ